MSTTLLLLILFVILNQHRIDAIPACIIIDTDAIQKSENDLALSATNNRSSPLLLRNLRMLDRQRSSVLPEFLVEPIPLSYIDVKSTTVATPTKNMNPSLLKKSLLNKNTGVDKKFAPCSIKVLNEIETQMVVPFEFRRLRLEQSDHRFKYFDDDPRETVPDLTIAVYERRSDPDGIRFCRTCRDGFWTQLTVCEAVRCDAELLRANPRLVTEWGEIKPLDGGILYAPSSVFAIYAFAFGPHCKRCEANGQWSKYALPELCSGIKFFAQPSSATTERVTTTTTTTTTNKTHLSTSKINSTLALVKLSNKKQ